MQSVSSSAWFESMISRRLAIIVRRIRSILRREQVDAELARELRAHLEHEEAENRGRGMAGEEARYAARRRLGGVSQIAEECRDARRVNWFEHLLQDLRYAYRTLKKDRVFTVAAVVTLALGISVNTTIFSLVNGWLFRKPPLPDADRVTAIVRANPKKNVERDWVPPGEYLQWRAANQVFESMALTNTGETFNVSGGDHPLRISGIRVTADYFRVMGVRPILGRTFRSDEDRSGNDRVVVLSQSLWQNSFASDPNVVGRAFLLNGEKYTIVGVMNARFRLPAIQADLWIPLTFRPEELTARPAKKGYYLAYARLKPNLSLRTAQAEMNSLAAGLNREKSAEEREWTLAVMTLQEFQIRWENIRQPIAMLMAAVALVLLIACANVANLLVARGSSRQQELSVRLALGASRARLLGQLLVESLLIGLLGGGLGLALGFAGTALLRSALYSIPDTNLLANEIVVSQGVLIFTLAVSIATALLFGLGPALRASVIEPQRVLRQSGRGNDLSRGIGRKFLVAAEVTFAVVLVNGAALITRAIADEFNGMHTYDPKHLLTANLDFTGSRLEDPTRRTAFLGEVLAKIRSVPGIQHAAATSEFANNSAGTAFEARRRSGRLLSFLARPFVITPDFFQTLGLPPLQGREFVESDQSGSTPVVLVNAALARRFFPDVSALGQYLRPAGGNRWLRIVGIVPDLEPEASPVVRKPQIYECFLQNPSNEVTLVTRSVGDVGQTADKLRRAVWSVDRNLPVGEISSFGERVRIMYGGDVVFSTLLSVFGSLALLMAAVGIYGVMAYTVEQQTREIGLRMALGATRIRVLSKSIRQGLMLAVTGCGLGLVLSFPLPALFRSMFTGFRLDALVLFLAVILTVLLVALGATVIPALRAIRIDPMAALRHE
jgi:predicted permease